MRSPAPRWRLRKNAPKKAGAMMSAVLAVTLIFTATASADELDDRKTELETEQEKVQAAYEYLGEDIAKAVAQLNIYQSQLPAAQEALAAAETRVGDASAKVTDLNDRVALAQETRNTITTEIAEDQTAMEETEKVIGQIAAQAYKNGGVPSSLSLILGADGADSLTDSMSLAEQALRGQNATIEQLSEQGANNVNSEARLTAVEEEIAELKTQAETALTAEQTARDEAATEKGKVDTLIANTKTLNDQLEAERPLLEAQMATLEEESRVVNADIATRQAELLEKARLEEEARVAEANRIAAEEAALENLPVPVPQVASKTPGDPSAFGLVMPVSAPMNSGYGWRDTPEGTIDFYGKGGYLHSGADFAASCGAPVYAAAAGEVWRADQGGGEMVGTGNRVVLNHGVMSGNALATNYYHMERFVVSAGQWVNSGQLIGYVGQTGNAQGCHLHFETILNGAPVDPMNLL